MNKHSLPFAGDQAKPIIGMLHLPPLPGAPDYSGDIRAVRERVPADAQVLARGGVSGLMLENFGDTPFFPGPVPAYVVAQMTAIAREIRRSIDLPLGINVLRNDGCSALAVAHAVGAEFIRVNVLCGARVTDQGLIGAVAHDLLRLRSMLDAREIRIFADVNVKHSSPLGPPRSIEHEVGDLIERGGADAVIVSGAGTGAVTDEAELAAVKAAAGDVPVLVGSGVSVENVARLLQIADGVIVGTSLKKDGLATNPVDPDRVKAFMEATR